MSGAQVVGSGGTAIGTQVSGGTETVFGTDSGATVASGVEIIGSGGVATSDSVLSGATQTVSSGGTAISAGLSGGTQNVAGLASATSIFASGIVSLLGGTGRVRTACPDCHEPMALDVSERRLAPFDAVVHFGIPARRWWDDIIHT